MSDHTKHVYDPVLQVFYHTNNPYSIEVRSNLFHYFLNKYFIVQIDNFLFQHGMEYYVHK